MIAALRRKLEALAERHQEIGLLLGEAGAAADPARWKALNREYAQLQPLADALAAHAAIERERSGARELAADPEYAELAAQDEQRLAARLAAIEAELETLLLPRDPYDDANLFLEVRAGTGGDEAALFAGDLLRMYLRYAERQGWLTEIVNVSPGEHGGYKEAVARIEGRGAYSKLRFESGTHRVQRVPTTESQGRIHTSAATVAILPELPAVDAIELRDADLRIDTFRASGAGGQHVNKTDSAIRITHLPSGIVVECQDERSQHKNRARALTLLQARLLDEQRAKQTAAQAQSRRLQVGSGDRSQRIRTYNFPQGRVTDHRVGLTLHRLPEVLDGDLDELIGTLAREHQADELKLLTEQA
jgi:peptide chain release factor 1